MHICSGPDTNKIAAVIPAKRWLMRAYKSSNALSKLPSSVTGLQPIGTEVRVCGEIFLIPEHTITADLF
jgi:hypothetical protein